MIGDRTGNYEEWDVTHRYDSDEERPSQVVIRTVAAITNRGVCSIEPLFASIEPDALDAFVTAPDRDSTTWISFFYGGCRVYVDGESVAVSQVNDSPE